MSRVFIDAVGLFAPGLEGWQSGKSVLAGEADYQPVPLPKYKPSLLPANERRRATSLVRLAFGACEDAVGERQQDAQDLAAVFASSGGDYEIIDRLCRSLLLAERAVSPTNFHNSVHNAVAGYWSIASKSQAPSTSLCAYDYSVSAGMLEAITLVAAEDCPTLLVVYDDVSLPTFNQKHPIASPFSAAFWLNSQQSGHSIAALDMQLEFASVTETPAGTEALEALRLGNPAARCLPLLELLARGETGDVIQTTSAGQSLRLGVRSC